ncbi:MAG: PqqD family protein [Blastocatellales bacterium]
MNKTVDSGQVALARKDDLVVQEMPDEVLVYDLKSHKAHCLNLTAAFVWNHCDGQTTAAEIAGVMEQEWNKPVSEDVVWLALKQLGKASLLQEPLAKSEGRARFSRRDAIRRIGIGAAIAIPLVMTITAPESAHAATCVGANGCTAQLCGVPCFNTQANACNKKCNKNGNCVGDNTPDCN